MKTSTLLLRLPIIISSSTSTYRQVPKKLEPNRKGYSLRKLEKLKKFLENSRTPSERVMVQGENIFDWGNTSEKHLIHSIRKPLIHSLLGIAIPQKK